MSKTKITGKKLSIQLGREETQIVLLGSGAEILHSVTVETPSGAVEDGSIRNQDAVRDMLKAALKTPEFKNVRQAVFTLCTSQVITETVTTPDLPAAKLEKLMQANVDMYFPVDVHDYKLVWQVIGPKASENGAKELAVQLWAVPNGMVSRYYHVANACGLSVAAIDYCGNSIASAIGASFAKPGKFSKERKKLNLNAEISLGKKKKVEPVQEEDADQASGAAPDTTLHLLLEKDILGMTFVQNGQVVLQRFVRCGSDPAYQFSELAMMLEYFQAMDLGRGSEVQGVVAGALAERDDMLQELADVLGITLTRFAAGYDLRWFLCVGAANTTMEFGIPNLNKPGTAKRQFQSDLPQYGLLLVSGLAVVAVVMTLLSSRLGWDSDIAALQNQQNMLTLQNAKVSGFADNYYEYESMYSAYSADWNTIFDKVRTSNDNLVRMMEELEEMLPENASVTNMQIMADGLNISFATEDKEDAAYLIMKMREMEYAKPEAFSNLAGGGAGPATTYGSQTEQAPKEGSAEGFTDKEMFDLALGNADKADLLWDTYGRQPEADSPTNTMAATLGRLPSSSSLRIRSRAFEDMLDKNPFAANWFYELLKNDAMNYLTGKSNVLAKYIADELIASGANIYSMPKDYDTYQTLLAQLVGIITKNEERMSAAETLMSGERDLELLYVYHLKINGYMSYDKYETPYYMNVDTLRADMNNGGSKIGDATLDNGMNQIFAYLVEAAPTEPGETTAPTVPGETTAPTVPGETTIPTEPGETTEPTKPLDPNEVIAQMMGQYLVKYLTEGTTENPIVDGMIENFLTTGSTGSEAVDKAIIETVKSEVADKELKDLVKLYVEHVGSDLEVSTGNPALDQVIELVNDVVVNGGTGDEEKDEKLKELYDKIDELYQEVVQEILNPTDPTQPGETTSPTEPTVSESQIGKYLSDFLANGTTKDDAVDQQIKDFLLTGSTKDKELDKEVEDYINAGHADKELKALMRAYVKDKKTGNETVDAMMAEMMANPDNVNTVLKARVIKLLREIATEVPEVSLEDAIGNYLITFMSNLTTQGSIFHDGLEKDDDSYKSIDIMLRKYLETGETGKTELDNKLNSLVQEGYFDNILKLWLDQYRQGKGLVTSEFDGERKLNAEAVHAIFASELAGTTPPNKEISKRFGIVWALIAQEAAAKTQGGGGGGAAQQPQDTRIHFTAVLSYNPGLREAELNRKGLNNADKVEPLEVGE